MNKDLKHCPDCEETKPRSEFYPNRGRKDGHQSVCQLCQRARTRDWQAKNREKYLTYQRRYKRQQREGGLPS